MSFVKMEKAVGTANLSPQDRKWFVQWIGWYARFCKAGRGEPLPVDVGRVIAFLQQQKQRGRAARQRLPAIRAVEFYRNLVRKSDARSVLGA